MAVFLSRASGGHGDRHRESDEGNSCSESHSEGYSESARGSEGNSDSVGGGSRDAGRDRRGGGGGGGISQNYFSERVIIMRGILIVKVIVNVIVTNQ